MYCRVAWNILHVAAIHMQQFLLWLAAKSQRKEMLLNNRGKTQETKVDSSPPFDFSYATILVMSPFDFS